MNEVYIGVEKCPKCGEETETSYGLAGGGCGPYTYCLSDICDWFYKEQDEKE